MSFNRWQPIRERIDTETNSLRFFATMPKLHLERARFITSRQSQVAQMRLYRAACQGYIDLQVVIAELYEFCFHDVKSLVSKTQMGITVTDAVVYEPRLLVNNRKVGKAAMTYTFRHPDDLKYGLEWQICTWLWKFLNQTAAQDSLIGSREDMLEELECLANSDEREYLEVYEWPLAEFSMAEPDWHTLCDGLKEEFPEMPKEERAFVRPPPPRRINQILSSASDQTDWRESLRARKAQTQTPDEA